MFVATGPIISPVARADAAIRLCDYRAVSLEQEKLLRHLDEASATILAAQKIENAGHVRALGQLGQAPRYHEGPLWRLVLRSRTTIAAKTPIPMKSTASVNVSIIPPFNCPAQSRGQRVCAGTMGLQWRRGVASCSSAIGCFQTLLFAGR